MKMWWILKENEMFLKEVEKFKPFVFTNSFHGKDEVFECNGVFENEQTSSLIEPTFHYDLTKIGKLVDGKIVAQPQLSYSEKFRTLAFSAGEILEVEMVGNWRKFLCGKDLRFRPALSWKIIMHRIFILTTEDQTFARRLDEDEAAGALADSRMNPNNDIKVARQDILNVESGAIFEVFSADGNVELLIVMDI